MPWQLSGLVVREGVDSDEHASYGVQETQVSAPQGVFGWMHGLIYGPSLEDVLAKIGEDHASAEEGCKTLANLAGSSQEERTAIMAAGGVDVVIGAMGRHEQWGGVQQQGCRVLGNLAALGTVKSSLVVAGGVEAILGGMVAHEAKSGVQATCCLALGNIATTGDNKMVIAAAGGTKAVVDAMRAHKSVVLVQKRACSALANFAFNDDSRVAIAAAGAIELVVGAMRAHKAALGVQEHGCRALYKLAANADNKVAIAKEGAVKVMQSAIRNHRRNRDAIQLVYECRRAISEIAPEEAEAVEVPAEEACKHAAQSLAHAVVHEAKISTRPKYADLALEALEGDLASVSKLNHQEMAVYHRTVIAMRHLMHPPHWGPKSYINNVTPIPVLWGGFNDPQYGSSFKPLLDLAVARGGYLLFHDTEVTHSTKFGQLMVTAGVTTACKLTGKARQDADNGLADNVWTTTSRRFVKSFKSKKVIVALNCPPRFFPYTIMYKTELPTLKEFHPTAELEVYIVTSLPTIELGTPKIQLEEVMKVGEIRYKTELGALTRDQILTVEELDTNRGPAKEDQASCSQYEPYFAELNLKGTCRDCPSDDLASCTKLGGKQFP